jgi:SAM-dependent methyltransferase
VTNQRRPSVAFDRAAPYYDASRIVSDDSTRRQTELLAGEIGPRGRALEIGVGTGQVSLPLHAAGIDVVGLDLSLPMLRRLQEKAGGASPFPIVQGDSTLLPFRDRIFGAVVMRWVLHLVPDWREAAREVVRVLRPGGVMLVNHGGFTGVGVEVRKRMQEFVGRPLPPAGLDWDAWLELADEMRGLGAEHRQLPSYVEHSDEPLGRAVDGIEQGRMSWTWGLSDEDRVEAARSLRSWLEERYGALDRPYPHDTEIVWHAYDLPTD